MKNRYEIRGDIVVISVKCKKEVLPIKISLSDFEKVNSFPNLWRGWLDKKSGNIYVSGMIQKNKKRFNYILHRFIMDAPKDMQVDHINHDTLDNTRKNLRIVTLQENSQNRDGAYITNKSTGVRGVSFRPEIGKYRARATINRKQYYVGLYSTIEEANRAIVEFRARHMPFSSSDTQHGVSKEFDYMYDKENVNPRHASSYAGVRYKTKTGKWEAWAKLNGKWKYIKCFDNETAASIARDIALFEMYGPNLPHHMKFNHVDLFNSSTVTWSDAARA